MTSSNALKCVVSDYETTDEVAPHKPFNIDFFAFKDYKKGHGKCTSYTVELERFNDE